MPELIGIATSDRLGFAPYYYRSDGRAACERGHGPTLRSLFDADPTLSRALSRDGVQGYLERAPDGETTCFAAVRKVPAGSELYVEGGSCGVRPLPALPRPCGPLPDLLDLLDEELDAAAGGGRRTALALSGGLDSALLAALLRRRGHSLPVYILDAHLEGYREVDEALATARSIGVPESDIVVAGADASDFAGALPDTIRAAEAPLFNLHPVSKLLLARRMRDDGIEVAITGDGADQVFAGAAAANYIPIVGALFRAAGVELRAPFAAETIIALARQLGTDPHKTALRRAAAGCVPDRILKRRKAPRLTPPVPIDAHFQPELTARIARDLDLPRPSLDTDPERVLWTTIGLLVASLEES